MSTNIKVQRICEGCGNEFIAKTTVTRYCSHRCNSRAYKANVRNQNIASSNQRTLEIKTELTEIVKAKDILSVKEAALLLGCSVRFTYRLIEDGTLKAVNLSERMIRIKRSDIDNILHQS